MTKRMVFLSAALLIICLSSVAVEAQQPAFTYQGKLSDNGIPANGKYDLQFALYDSASGGAQIGLTQTIANVSTSEGVFTVTLDFGASAFNGAARFLEISTRPSGGGAFTLLTPRQVLASTPYAVRSLSSATADTATNAINATSATNATTATTANNALQLGGVAANQYVLTGDTRLSDSRTPTAGSANYIQNTTSPQTSSNFNISGNGTAAGTLSGNVLNAATKYEIAGQRVLEAPAANQNTFLGIGAGTSNTTGTYNSIFGQGAGRLATTAKDNSFFGAFAGEKTTGLQNAFFGAEAGLNNTTGIHNIFMGAQTGYANTTGSNNTAIGDVAGSSNTVENDNTFIGGGSDGAPGITNATAMGANSQVTQSDSLVLGAIQNVNGSLRNTNVGIGTTAPAARLHVNGNTLLNGDVDVGIGTTAPAARLHVNGNTSLNGDVDVGVSPSFSQFTANARGSFLGNLAVGTDITWPPPAGRLVHVLGSEAALRLESTAGQPWEWRSTQAGRMNLSNLSNGTTPLTILPNGNVGLGITSPSAKLTVDGAGAFTGTLAIGSFVLGGNMSVCIKSFTLEIAQCSSSLRYKTDLHPFTGGLDLINRLQPITFKWKSDQSRDLGFGAEDVAAVEPLLVTRNPDGQVEGVKYDRLSAVFVNAFKEQQNQIEQQQAQIASLLKANARLSERVQAIEARTRKGTRVEKTPLHNSAQGRRVQIRK